MGIFLISFKHGAFYWIKKKKKGQNPILATCYHKLRFGKKIIQINTNFLYKIKYINKLHRSVC